MTMVTTDPEIARLAQLIDLYPHDRAFARWLNNNQAEVLWQPVKGFPRICFPCAAQGIQQ